MHRNRERIADLIAAGAIEAANPAALAVACEIVFLCVTGSPQVEAAITGADGLLAGAGGKHDLSSSTARPASPTRRRGCAPLAQRPA